MPTAEGLWFAGSPIKAQFTDKLLRLNATPLKDKSRQSNGRRFGFAVPATSGFVATGRRLGRRGGPVDEALGAGSALSA